MARTLFFRMVLRKFSEITNNKPIFSKYIFKKNINNYFLNMCFDLFSIIAKKVKQIRNNVVCALGLLVFLFCCAFTTGRCDVF